MVQIGVMPSATTPRTRAPRHTPEETEALTRAASSAWSDVRDAIAEGQRSPSGRFGDTFTQARLRAAMRGRPDWLPMRAAQDGRLVALAPFDVSTDVAGDIVDGVVVGDDPATPATGSAQEAELWSRAATLARQLREITARARQSARTGTDEALRDVASWTEQGVTAIVRPLTSALGGAVADATRPLAENAGQGFGFGLAVVAFLGLWMMTKKG